MMLVLSSRIWRQVDMSIKRQCGFFVGGHIGCLLVARDGVHPILMYNFFTRCDALQFDRSVSSRICKERLLVRATSL